MGDDDGGVVVIVWQSEDRYHVFNHFNNKICFNNECVYLFVHTYFITLFHYSPAHTLFRKKKQTHRILQKLANCIYNFFLCVKKRVINLTLREIEMKNAKHYNSICGSQFSIDC